MTNATKGRAIRYAAIGLDVGAPMIATATQFPIWVEKSSEATISGLFLLFALLSALPFVNQIKAWMKSPSVPVMWVILFASFVLMRNIIDEMIAVCFFGMAANILGAGVHKLGVYIEQRPDIEAEEGE
jgi:hypothetical protein